MTDRLAGVVPQVLLVPANELERAALREAVTDKHAADAKLAAVLTMFLGSHEIGQRARFLKLDAAGAQFELLDPVVGNGTVAPEAGAPQIGGTPPSGEGAR